MIHSDDAFDQVIRFYDQELPKLERAAETIDFGQWQREYSEGGAAYTCYGVDINMLTTETGCIYLSPELAATKIELLRFRSEGGNVPCPGISHE